MSLEFTKSSHLLFRIFLFSKGGNPKKTNARKETCLHCVCMETNAQSVHVDKRRADCLSYLLKWRGATLAEGQIEKVDLAAQDEVRFELFFIFIHCLSLFALCQAVLKIISANQFAFWCTTQLFSIFGGPQF